MLKFITIQYDSQMSLPGGSLKGHKFNMSLWPFFVSASDYRSTVSNFITFIFRMV